MRNISMRLFSKLSKVLG